MKTSTLSFFLVVPFLVFCSVCLAQSVKITGPTGSEKFGYHVKVVDNGNYVVADPFYDKGSTSDVGAVFLYHGFTHSLISKLTGSSANDNIGISGITLISGNKFIVRSANWDRGSFIDAGAVTIVDGTSGLEGEVSAMNSLVGSSSGDNVGSREIIDLKNGNYLVSTPLWANGSAAKAGAVTWFSGTAGITGEISASNSLVGSRTEDYLGSNVSSDLITVLSNGNYVVCSPYWDNSTASNVGAATLCSGTTGRVGLLSVSNSLTGSSYSDQVGIGGTTELTNGNFVVMSYSWNNGSATAAGAATWVNASIALTGVVSVDNSLVGTKANDMVGISGTAALKNGNYLVGSSFWNFNKGAVTWGNGTTGIYGAVDASNSLIGSKNEDQVGGGFMLALSNGNFVIGSPRWDNGLITDAGSATWGDGSTGIVGEISVSNSLIGSSTSDGIGLGGVNTNIALSNGNYVVAFSGWDNGGITDAGAVVWGNGTSGSTGMISSTNALVGSSDQDKVGVGGVFALDNGNYVVNSYDWKNGSGLKVGAVTWGNGSSGIVGAVSSTSSLVGSQEYDQIGVNGIVLLPNGDYAVCSSGWDNGSISNAGALTKGSKSSGVKGEVSSANSLVGVNANESLGGFRPLLLSNGVYVVVSPYSSKPGLSSTGALSLATSDDPLIGLISDRSLITGSNSNDYIGYGGAQALPNGGLLIKSPYWKNGSVSSAGALTWASATKPLSGTVNECNSVVGQVTNGIEFTTIPVYSNKYNYVLIGVKNENALAVFDPSDVSLADSERGTTVDLTAEGITTLVDEEACALIANLASSGVKPVTGTVEAQVWKEATVPTYSGIPFVARHTQISPETNSSTATGTITLYFTQPEFNAFNDHSASALNLPTGPDDAAGKANLRIGKFSGKSSDNSGLPSTYPSGGAQIIDPDNDKIVWNPNLLRWEVTFSVAGFSGFVVQTNPNPLPVRLISFEGKAYESDASLKWEIADAVNFDRFEIERSTDGKKFEKITGIGQVDDQANYSYVDKQALIHGNLLYYRLRMVDKDDTYAFSRIITIKFENLPNLKAFPNPFVNGFRVKVPDGLGEQKAVIRIYSQNGSVLFEQTELTNGGSLGVSTGKDSIPVGVYILSVQIGDRTHFQRIVKGQ